MRIWRRSGRRQVHRRACGGACAQLVGNYSKGRDAVAAHCQGHSQSRTPPAPFLPPASLTPRSTRRRIPRTRRLAHAYPPAVRPSAFWPAQVFSWTYVHSGAAAAGAMYSAAAAQPTAAADGTRGEFKLRLRAATPIRTVGTPRKRGMPCTLDASKSANGIGPLCTDSDNHQARYAPPGPPLATAAFEWSASHRLGYAKGSDPSI